MAAILLENVPEDLHRRLREEAARHHRSMTGHALALIEQGLRGEHLPPLPEPERPLRPFTRALLRQAIHEGRR
jgi:hypothetical protein